MNTFYTLQKQIINIYNIYIYIYIFRLIKRKKAKPFQKKKNISIYCLCQIFLLYRILPKIFLQIECTIKMGKEQITSINLIIYVHIVNLLQLIIES